MGSKGFWFSQKRVTPTSLHCPRRAHMSHRATGALGGCGRGGLGVAGCQQRGLLRRTADMGKIPRTCAGRVTFAPHADRDVACRSHAGLALYLLQSPQHRWLRLGWAQRQRLFPEPASCSFPIETAPSHHALGNFASPHPYVQTHTQGGEALCRMSRV